MVGRQAQANPEGVRKVRDAGHTVATHTQSHPSGMHRLSIERAKAEIDDGIANVTAALGDGGAAVMSPFFRIPGLARNDAIEEYTRALDCRSGARISRPTTRATSPRRGSTTLRCRDWPPRARASCCCTTARASRTCALS